MKILVNYPVKGHLPKGYSGAIITGSSTNDCESSGSMPESITPGEDAFALLSRFSEFCKIREKCPDKSIDQKGVYMCESCEQRCRFENCRRIRAGGRCE